MYAHYLFNAFDTANNGSIKFKVKKQQQKQHLPLHFMWNITYFYGAREWLQNEKINIEATFYYIEHSQVYSVYSVLTAFWFICTHEISVFIQRACTTNQHCWSECWVMGTRQFWRTKEWLKTPINSLSQASLYYEWLPLHLSFSSGAFVNSQRRCWHSGLWAVVSLINTPTSFGCRSPSCTCPAGLLWAATPKIDRRSHLVSVAAGLGLFWEREDSPWNMATQWTDEVTALHTRLLAGLHLGTSCTYCLIYCVVLPGRPSSK